MSLLRRQPGYFSLFLAILPLLQAVESRADQACPPAPKAGDPVELYPADQIRNIKPGTIAQAYTVFQGTTAECFQVLLNGVDPDGFGVGHDVIYFTPLPGPAADTNIVHGMSGSPVYLDGKLLGALSLDISLDFTVAPTGGITPAVYMKEILENHARAVAQNHPSFFASAFDGYDSNKGEPDTRLAAQGAQGGSGPATDLHTSGISPQALGAFREGFQNNGFNLVSGGASAPDAGQSLAADATALAPGEMIVVPLVSGDVSMTVAGTVTYNDGKQVLAFGHPFNQAGSVKLPMMTGEVIKIVDSSHESFKITKGLKTVGALVEDRATGIMGILGEEAPTIPMTMQVKTDVRDHDFHMAISRVPNMLPMLAATVIDSILTGVNEAGDGNTLHLETTVKIAGHGDYTFSEMYLDETADHAESSKGLAKWALNHIQGITGNPSESGDILSIDVKAEILPGARLMTMTKVESPVKTAKAGSTIPLKATFRLPGYPKPLTHSFSVKLPADVRPGAVTLTVATSVDFNQDMVQALNAESSTDSLEARLKILHMEHPNGALYVDFSQGAGSKPAASGRKASSSDEVALPLPAVFSGKAQKVSLTVVP